MSGKTLRMARIIPPEREGACIIPIDHAVTYGPMEGIVDPCRLLREVIAGGADSIILHKGALTSASHHPELASASYIMHLSASTAFYSNKAYKVLVGSVEEAIRLGAVGVSVHISLGIDREPEMLRDFGRIAESCNEWGMPLLAMMYIEKPVKDASAIAHAARVAQELGADIVKVDFPGTAAGMREVAESVRIPVVIAGGTLLNDNQQFLTMIADAMKGGAAGVSIGRNIFQHENPKHITRLIVNLVRKKWSLPECLEALDYSFAVV